MLEDPRINFAISTRAGENGVDHLGLQVDEESELAEITERLKKADLGFTEKAKLPVAMRNPRRPGCRIRRESLGKRTEQWRTPRSFTVNPSRKTNPNQDVVDRPHPLSRIENDK